MHELAHLIGLGHVDDEAQMMHPTSRRAKFGAGDLTGLRKLCRKADCLTTPSPP